MYWLGCWRNIAVRYGSLFNIDDLRWRMGIVWSQDNAPDSGDIGDMAISCSLVLAQL